MRRTPRVVVPVTLATFTLLAALHHRHKLRTILANLKHAIRTLNLITALGHDLHTHLTAPSPTSSSSLPPPTLRNLLRLAASEDGQTVIRAAASGAVSALIPSNTPTPTTTTANNNNNNNSPNPVHALLFTLASPHGRQVVSSAVSAAVREAMRGAAANPPPFTPNDIISTVSSDQGRKLVLDVVQTITATAVPYFVHPQPPSQPHPPSPLQQQYRYHTKSTTISTSTSMTPSKQASRRASISSISSSTSASASASASAASASTQQQNIVSNTSVTGSSSQSTTVRTGPTSKVVVDRFVSRTRTTVFWERLAILAIRDRVLVQDIVRVIVTCAVRTYLITNAEIRGEYAPPSIPVANPSKSSKQQAEISGQQQVATSSVATAAPTTTPVWRLIARSVAIDIKRLVHSVGSRPAASSGWTVF